LYGLALDSTPNHHIATKSDMLRGLPRASLQSCHVAPQFLRICCSTIVEIVVSWSQKDAAVQQYDQSNEAQAPADVVTFLDYSELIVRCEAISYDKL